MSKMKFGDYLYQLRINTKPKKLAQKALADPIDVSRQYIDAIEKCKPGTSPPTFQQCIVIMDLLQLDTNQRFKFMWLAFSERIRHNFSFYEYLTSRYRSELLGEPTRTSASAPKNAQLTCHYAISWEAKDGTLFQDTQVEIVLEKAILDSVESSGYELSSFQVVGTHVHIGVHADGTLSPDTFVSGLKDLCSRSVKNQIPNAGGSTPSLWSSSYQIRTLESNAISAQSQDLSLSNRLVEDNTRAIR